MHDETNTPDLPPTDPDVNQHSLGGASAAPPPERDTAPSTPSWKNWVAVGATAAVVGVAAIYAISAATSSDSSPAAVSTQAGGTGTSQNIQGNGQNGPGGGFPGRPGGFGTIASIDGSTLTIEDQSGTSTKVLTSSSTKVTSTETGSVDDIKVGDTVTVVGTGSETEIAATQVTDDGKVSADEDTQDRPGFDGNGPPGAPNGQLPNGQPPSGQFPNGQAPNGQVPGGAADMAVTRGVVQSVGDGTFTVTGINDTTVTVTTDSSTTVSIAKEVEVSDLEVGDTVMVQGDESDGTITATSIREGALGGPMGGPGGPGGGQFVPPSDTGTNATPTASGGSSQ